VKEAVARTKDGCAHERLLLQAQVDEAERKLASIRGII